MKTADRIRHINATSNGLACLRLCNFLRSHGFDYDKTLRLFRECDPSISTERFNHLLVLADAAVA